MFKQNISFEIWGGESGKYRLKDNYGNNIDKTPEDTCKRVALTLAAQEKPENQEKYYKQFMSVMGTKFAGGGRIMANIGASEYKKETSPINCTVMRQIPDSLEGIMQVAKEAALTLKSGCGVGYDFSTIRPAGAHVFGAGSATSGIISFMKIFDSMCSTIMSGGSRRGAQMACLDICSPEIESFITAKRQDGVLRYFNCSILVTDKFMKAVADDLDWDLWFWEKNCDLNAKDVDVCIIKKDDIPYNYPQYNYFSFAKDHAEVEFKNCLTDTVFIKKVYKTIKAKDLFDLIIKSTYNFWEPGFMLIDRVNIENNLWFCEVMRAANPCFSGDTMIAVADGRNAVSIKQLAEEGKDVPVYSVDKKGKVSIKIGRNPRITGTNKKMIRVTLDDGSAVEITPDHKCILIDGSVIEAKNLKYGDSLPRFKKDAKIIKKGGRKYLSVHCNIHNYRENQEYEHRLIYKFFYPGQFKALYDQTKKNGFAKTGGIVIHHKDYNSINNNPDNLEVMTFSDHAIMHGKRDNSGERNPRYSGITSEDIKNHAMKLTKSLGRRFSVSEWRCYADNNGLPQQTSKFRSDVLGTVKQLSCLCALELNMEHIYNDPRTIKSYQSMLQQGYSAKIKNNTVYIEKTCKICNNIFDTHCSTRETTFCSSKCLGKYNANNAVWIENNRNKNCNFYKTRSIKLKAAQAKIYSDLKFKLNRDPKFVEWAEECSKNNLSYRIGKTLKFGYKKFAEIKEAGENYNHKVMSVVELNETQTVYNITVDDNHTVGVITKINSDKISYDGIFLRNCGEQFLNPSSSCLLGSMILPSYVGNPFSNNATFDFDKLANDVKITSRILDNVVELNNLPLKELQDQIILKRRHGLGITGLGSVFNMLGISYGSKESVELTDKISFILADASLRENILLAKEKGPAPIFNDVSARKLVMQSGYMKRLLGELPDKEQVMSDILTYGLRYSHATSIAPTGTLSLTWGNNCSNGIEPVFANSYLRNIRDPQKKTKTQEEVCDYSFYLWKEMFGDKELPKYWRVTDDLTVMDHLIVQSAAQKWCDSAISKTINVPADYSFEDFKSVYFEGWKLGLKGITTYRPNAEISSGVLMQKKDLDNSEYTFTLEGGSEVVLKGSDSVEYDGETHNVANLFDALKEGIYGNM